MTPWTRIEEVLASRLGVRTPTIVKTSWELAAIVDQNPIACDPANVSRCLVVFASDRPALERLTSVAPLVAPQERFAIGEHAAYLLCAPGIRESAAAKALLGRAARESTTRNWATTLALHALAGELDGAPT
jgi:uncharacterized protein (DUF1697 family)